MHVGIAGEVRCVVTKADGKVKIDTGYQKNLILNQGLEFFGGKNGDYINAQCAIGSGNSTPSVTQTKLDAFIALVSGNSPTSDYSYVDKDDGMYRMWEQKTYRFNAAANLNISEIGLVSSGNSPANYYLTTRALIKDSLGAPTSLSLKIGETLDVYYKIHKIIDTRDKSYVVNVLDGSGGAVPYNVVVRPAYVGNPLSNNVISSAVGSRNANYGYSLSELSGITTGLVGYVDVNNSSTKDPYVPLSYKLITNINYTLANANADIRSISSPTGHYSNSFFPVQIRFGRVSDDAPLTKTAKDTLTIPLEFSWGRYEGAL